MNAKISRRDQIDHFTISQIVYLIKFQMSSDILMNGEFLLFDKHSLKHSSVDSATEKEKRKM